MQRAAESIVVGTDGSPRAMSALHTAAEMAKAIGARVHLVCAYDPLAAHGWAPEASAYFDPCKDAESCLERAAEQIRSEGLEVETYAVSGNAADALVDVAETNKARLIIVGNKGMAGSRRFLLGSVPNKVSHHASCSVMIVHTA
jgi:nucleotide-binding universal stress UspA family protein